MNYSRSQQLVICCITAVLFSCSAEPTPAEYLERARSHYSTGNFSAATIEARNTVKGEAENADARLLLGELLLLNGDAAGAEKELRKARELGIPDIATRPMLASTLLRQRKFDELLVLTTDGLEPADASRLLAARSLAWLASDELSSARQDAQRALQLAPASTDAMLALARLNAVENDLPAATNKVKKLLDAAPENGEGWEFMGDLERTANKKMEALDSYSKAIEFSPRQLSARLKRAQLNIEQKNAKEALKDLEALTTAGVKLPEIEVGRGQLKLGEGDFEGAQGHFEQSLALAPDYVPAISNLALSHLLIGNLGQAEQYAKQLLDETGGSDQARRLLAAIQLENGQYSLTQKTIEPVVHSGLSDYSSIKLLSTALLKQGEYDNAITLMVDALRAGPEDALKDTSGDTSPAYTRLPGHVLRDEIVHISDNNTSQTASNENLLDENERLIVHIVELLVRGERNSALGEAQELETTLPDNAVPYNLIGRIQLANGNIVEARNAFETAFDIDENNATAGQFLADLDALNGDLDTARNLLEHLLKNGTKSESILLQLSRIEAKANDESAMLAWIQRAKADYPDSATTSLLLARYYADKQDPERSLQTLVQLEPRYHDRPDVLQIESASLILLQRFADALPKLEKLVAQQPEIAQWRFLKALALSGTDDNAGAIEELNAALELDPKHVPSQLALANVDIQRGQLDNAFTRVDSLRQLIPGSPELEQLEARYEAGRDKSVKVATVAENDAETRIESSEQLISTARKLWSSDQHDKAIALLKTWLTANPEDATARLTLANSYIVLDRTNDAVEQYEIVLQSNDQTLTDEIRLIALNNLAWHLLDIDSDRAVAYAKSAVEIGPGSAAVLDTLAMIHLSRKDTQAAKTAFDKAMALGVNNPTILFNGSKIELALGNKTAARALLEPLVTSKQEFPEAEEAAQMLQQIQ